MVGIDIGNTPFPSKNFVYLKRGVRMAFDEAYLTACQKFVFREQDGQLVEHMTGKIYKGYVCLKIYDNGSFRITIGDAFNATKAIAKDFLVAIGNKPLKILKRFFEDDLCHFDISQEDIACGTKEMRVKAMYIDNELKYMLMCYDFTTYEGRGYFFEDYAEIKKWSLALGIEEYEIFDYATGETVDIECFE